MGGELRPTRYAHCEGHTDVCFSADGKSLITCGQDGEVRIFQGIDDDDCVTHAIGEQAHAVAYQFPNIVVGCDYNCVQYFDAEDGAPGRVITRFTAHPTCLDISENLIAAGGSDMVVRVHSISENTDTVLEGHSSAILSVALDPKGEYVVSSSCDGSVKVWFLASETCVKTFPGLHPTSNRFPASITLCRATFTPSGGHLLIPVAEKVNVFSRNSWQLERHFKLDDPKNVVSIVTVSKCGSLVAMATNNGCINVFDYTTGTSVLSVQHPRKLAITALVWNPNVHAKKELAFTDANGQLGTVVDIDYDQTASKGASSGKSVPAMSSDVFPPLEVDAALDNMLDDINDENHALSDPTDDLQDDNDISLAKIKSQMGFADDEHGTFIGLPSQKATTEASAPSVEQSAIPAAAAVVAAPVAELQRCFTPSMTPEHHSQRYMIWNKVGVIKQYNLEEDCSIGVEFHDSSLHHSIHLPNAHSGYSIAGLSHQALVLASEASADTPSRAWVQLLLASSSGSAQDWQVELPDGEDCIAVACSNKVVCVASSKRIVRVLSVGGVSLDVLCVPGPLVCMAAHEHHLMLLYHAAVGSGGDQQINMLVLNTEKPTVAGQRVTHLVPVATPVALCPSSFVSWAGFSDEGTPVVVDSAGYVRMLHPNYPGSWTIILASKATVQGRSDHHFVLGVSERECKVRSVLCRGSRYPPLVPPPYVSLTDFKIPVFDGASEKGEMEATVLRCGLQLAPQLQEEEQDETEHLLQTTLIKLFAVRYRIATSITKSHDGWHTCTV
ncbi:WD repeat and HMG-box DNA-binding protein 1 [Hyalella azteca]|uniref:WD repeat and HMG-box DNA-binding protein 1 n=1 Tax=Hyalella azteca TaxID=294128 RepID=A0A8B7NMF1_HYAAZ|nr:WD repeat and HMG-box DNA-binding protein 1 [Hyalella azteca]